MRFEEGTLVTRVRLRHPTLGLTLEFADTVDFHECLLVRRCRVTNEKQRERAVRIFFHHDFHISGTEVGDTAYYEPERRAVLHYKGGRWFLANGAVPVDSESSSPMPASANAISGLLVGVHRWDCGYKGLRERGFVVFAV